MLDNPQPRRPTHRGRNLPLPNSTAHHHFQHVLRCSPLRDRSGLNWTWGEAGWQHGLWLLHHPAVGLIALRRSRTSRWR